MSNKSTKKSKEKPTLKVKIWICTFEAKDTQEWVQRIAEDILKDYKPDESWKGKLTIYNDYFITKSKSKTYFKKYDFQQLCGLMSSSNNKLLLVLGILDNKMLYMIMRFDNIDEKVRIISLINSIKGPDKFETSQRNSSANENCINERTDLQSNLEIRNSYQFHNEMSEIDDYGRNTIETSNGFKSNNSVISKPETYNEQRFQSTEFLQMKPESSILLKSAEPYNYTDWDMNDSNEIMWIENTKYIDYVPSLGKNIQTDDGSIYMYCAQQVIPTRNYTDSESESD